MNAGTVFYLGYDDHYQQGDLIEGDRDGDGFDDQLYFSRALRRTNRAIFASSSTCSDSDGRPLRRGFSAPPLLLGGGAIALPNLTAAGILGA